MDELGAAILKLVDRKRRVVGFKWKVTHGNINHWPYREGSPFGWYGRVWVRYKNSSSGFGSDPFNGTLTYPGTGGAGSYDGPWKDICAAKWQRYGQGVQCYGWDYRFFDSDWSLATSEVNQNWLAHKLAGKAFSQPTHIFEWYDEGTVAADRKFLISSGVTL